MKTLIPIIVIAATLLAREPQAPGALMIDHVNIVDGTGRVLRDGAIVVENGRIREVGPRRTIGAATTRVFDARGKWAIPGLIDTHVHLDQSGDLYARPDIFDVRRRKPYESELAWVKDRMPVTLRRYLACGVTSIIDMGGPMWTFDVRDHANASNDAPHLAAVGPLIATHPSPELESSDSPVVVIDSVESARDIVRRVLARRPDLIKILWVFEHGDDLDRQSEIVRAAIEESHARGVRVGAHALELTTAKAALRAGADILVHSVEDVPVDAEFLGLLKERDVPYIPTLAVLEGYYKVFGQNGKSIPMTDIDRRLGDPIVIQSWSDLLEIPIDQIDRTPHFPRREKRPVMFDNLAKVAKSGARVAAGTDAGNIGTLHGSSIHREFELMAEAGMKPAEILVAATRNAAAVMGREADLGSIEKGKIADIVLLNADPTSNVKNLRKIYKVMKNGAFIDIDERMLSAK